MLISNDYCLLTVNIDWNRRCTIQWKAWMLTNLTFPWMRSVKLCVSCLSFTYWRSNYKCTYFPLWSNNGPMLACIGNASNDVSSSPYNESDLSAKGIISIKPWYISTEFSKSCLASHHIQGENLSSVIIDVFR